MILLQGGQVLVAGSRLAIRMPGDAWRARLAVMPQGLHLPDMTLADWLGRG